MIRREGLGGSMKVFCAMNSFSMSFWIVPPIWLSSHALLFRDHDIHGQQDRGRRVDRHGRRTLSRGIPSKRISMSFRVSIATPHFPTSPLAMGRIAVVSHEGRVVEGNGEACFAYVEEGNGIADSCPPVLPVRRTSSSSRAFHDTWSTEDHG